MIVVPVTASAVSDAHHPILRSVPFAAHDLFHSVSCRNLGMAILERTVRTTITKTWC